MFKPSPVLRFAFTSFRTSSGSSTRQAAREALKTREKDSSIPSVPSCPSPTCPCAHMPPDLDIDRSKNLAGTMAAYNKHLLITTGQADWKSRIEDEKDNGQSWGTLTAAVKAAMGPKGSFHDPYHNVVVSTSSFEAPASQRVQAMLFPSFQVIEDIDPSRDSIEDLVTSFLLPRELHSMHSQLSEEAKSAKTRSETPSERWLGRIHPITAPTILVCSHNSRDMRCGILGPLLHNEFVTYINKRHALRNQTSSNELIHTTPSDARSFASHPSFQPDAVDRENNDMHPVNIGMISHVGGHKWAGNVIVYIPPDYHCSPVERKAGGTKPRDKTTGSKKVVSEDEALPEDSFEEGLSPLAGKGVWYGRVEPKHVEGIVEQTIGHGTVIQELFRGGINLDGTPLRL